jgi:hypothetical protein
LFLLFVKKIHHSQISAKSIVVRSCSIALRATARRPGPVYDPALLRRPRDCQKACVRVLNGEYLGTQKAKIFLHVAGRESALTGSKCSSSVAISSPLELFALPDGCFF